MGKAETVSYVFDWRRSVTDDNGLSAGARHAALTLTLYMSAAGESCFPSLAQMAARMSRDRSTVTRALAELRDAGWLEIEQSDGGRNKRNHYTATIPETLRGRNVSAEANVAPENVNVAGAQPQVPRHTTPTEEQQTTSVALATTSYVKTRNEIWDALTDVFGAAETPPERSRRGKTVRELIALNATPDVVRERARECMRRFSDTGRPITERALMSHWSTLDKIPRAIEVEGARRADRDAEYDKTAVSLADADIDQHNWDLGGVLNNIDGTP